MSVIASASKDVKFHQWPEGSLTQTYLPKSHEGQVQSISWGKDGSWVVLVPDSGPTEIISIKENVKLLQTIQDVYRPSCASFHTTTKKLVGIGTVCGQVMIYDIKGKTVKKRFPRVSSKICSLHYNCKDTHLAATCNNGEILLLSNLCGNISSVFKVPNSSTISSANFHRIKRNLFAAGSDTGLLAEWDINTNNMLCNVQAHQAAVTGLAFSPLSYNLLVTGGLDRKFAFYDLATKNTVTEVVVNNAVTSLDYSHCGMYLGIGFQNGKIAIYDNRTFTKPLSVFDAHEGGGTSHLYFQKVLTNATHNNSVFEITVEELSNSNQSGGDRLPNYDSLVDSAGMVDCDDSSSLSKDAKIRKPSQDYGDSFMLAIDLEGTTYSGSTKGDSFFGSRSIENYGKLTDLSKRCTIYQYPTGNKTNMQIPALPNKISSTPKYIEAEVEDAVESPILCSNQTFPVQYEAKKFTQPSPSSEELRAMIKEVVGQEIDALKCSLRVEFMDMLHQLRRHFLDLQMSIIKEFVKMETQLEHLEPNGCEFVPNDLLINKNNWYNKK